MKKTFLLFLAAILSAACEKVDYTEGEEDVILRFMPTTADLTTRASSIGNYFTKLNIQMFDAQGEKVFEKVKTQTSNDEDFGTFSLKIKPGTYWIVAVGHSSTNSATIKSTEAVQFTASEGEKLTDTFSHCSRIEISDTNNKFTLPMYRAGAMVQFCLTDTKVPDNFAYFLMEYTGGSANFNPTNLQGITKSSQSEKRIRNTLNIHQAYTFPYMATSGTLKMTVSGLDSEGTVIRKRVFTDVPVTRNRITTYTGKFFEEGDGVFTQSEFGFVVHADWEGEDKHNF